MQKTDLTSFVGTKIKSLRKKNNLTQKELARKLGVATSTITNYETGFRSANQDVLFDLAELFGVKIDYFFPSHDNQTGNLSLREKELLDNYRKLNESGKLKAEGYIHGLSESENS
ncbi:helix-turn-helix domain-containing protein [Listeria monocytogenes]|nr:helix-turn-helix transcriptional regulator [Listeria monocytogenes]EJV0593933.1 helix-turn-helix transcriptional regulator [Listeria monocytogenes]